MTTIQEAFGSEGPAVEHGDTSSESIIREAVSTRRIVKLSEETINRIAAGEVVQRPSSALKELLENSIDAGSTSIKVITRDGGIKQLVIQDNGSGIKKADLPLLCERFATSKLTTFSDLESIQTYGFRGEALASISHVAHLTVTTKTREDACGYKARYLDGKLVPLGDTSKDAEPRPIAATDGTQITVEDLFYNTPTRRKALRSAADEYSRILDVVSKYAIHNAGISMSCKKHNSNSFDLQTAVGATTLAVIEHVYSATVRKEMNEIAFENAEFHLNCKGYVTGANYSAKRGTFIFFINHRLVDCTPLKRNLEAFYGSLLPKGGSPFVYLSLIIHPARVDVNVSPTKSEVQFMDQDDIIELVCNELQTKLAKANQSRAFTVQTLLPSTSYLQVDNSAASASTSKTPSATGNARLPPQKLVRTDAKAQTLDSMINFTSTTRNVRPSEHELSENAKGKRKASDLIETASDEGDEPRHVVQIDSQSDDEDDVDGVDRKESSGGSKYRDTAQPADMHVPTQSATTRRTKITEAPCDLTSIQELRVEIIARKSDAMEAIMKSHTFVGVIDLFTGRSMLQHGTRLYLVDHNVLSEELLYQLILRQFSELGRLKLTPAPKVRDLLELAMEGQPGASEAGIDPKLVIKTVEARLFEWAEMLEEYFSLCIDSEQGTLEAIPLILPGWTPDIDKLPLFLLRLGLEASWTSEKACFESVARELAFFNSPEPLSDASQEACSKLEGVAKKKHDAQMSQLKHVIFPAMRYLQPPKSVIDSKTIVHVASLENLYKVFERC